MHLRPSYSLLTLVSLLIVGGTVGCATCPPGKECAPASKPVAAPAAAAFQDVTASSGVQYHWTIAGKRPLNILQTIGNGCAFVDVNQDGNLDILLVGNKPALFLGDGKGKFTDASPMLGNLQGHFLGCAVGDIDNDGFPDIYLSGYREGRLLHNEAGKGFKDITGSSGIAPQKWGTSCAFVETRPGSGKLDLIIANYALFGPEPGIKQLCDTHDATGKMIQTSCGPRDYEPIKGIFYRNEGGNRFTEATKEMNFAALHGRGLGVAACDYDDSGQPSIAFANDEIGGDLMHGKPGKMTNVADVSGTAYDRDGNVHGGMGVAWGDYDNDGRFDLIVATYQGEPKTLYHNEGNGLFTDNSYPTGVGAATTPYVAFGTALLDFDNDGWLDLFFANGHVQDNIESIDAKATYRQPAQLFHNKGLQPNKQVLFEDISKNIPALQKPLVGRGLSVGDYDNDGRLDVLIVDSEGEPLLLHNEAPQAGHWLGVRLVGSKSNRDGYGAKVTLQVGDKRWVRYGHSDGSYLSASDSRVHFGCGTETGPATVTIRWPNGKTDVRKDIPLDRYTTVTEGSGSSVR